MFIMLKANFLKMYFVLSMQSCTNKMLVNIAVVVISLFYAIHATVIVVYQLLVLCTTDMPLIKNLVK